MRTLYCLAAAAALIANAGLATPALAQRAGGSFVIMLGNDTVAVERYTRTGNRIEGEIVSRVPRTTRTTYVATVEPNDALTRLELTSYAHASDSVVQRVTVQFRADSVITERSGRNAQRVAAPFVSGALTWQGNSFAMHEFAVQRARRAGMETVRVPVFPLGATEPWTLELRRARDSVFLNIELPGGAIQHEGRVDSEGRIQELRGVGGTYGSNVVRASQLDVAALRRGFERRDAAGQSLGQLSPRDTAQAQVAGATVTIDYSRPSVRGRTLLGGLLNERTVWRMGANQATHLHTDRDLVFGEHTVPAGTYTLFAVPGRESWTLIVNRQTGQWGTTYDEEQDLVRIPMPVTRASTRQEQFTIRAEPAANGGVLRVMWGDIVASAPFTVR